MHSFAYLRVVVAVVVASVLSAPAYASNWVELYLQGHGGGGGGSGSEETTAVAGFPVSDHVDFYERVGGPALGVEAGVKLLALDIHVDFNQFVGERNGRVLRGIVGVRMDFGEEWNFYLRLGVGGMLGFFGSDSLSGAEIGKTPVGFTARGGLGLLYKFAKVFAVGPVADVGYYHLLNGAIEPDVEALMGKCTDQACVEQQIEMGNVGAGYSTSQGIDFTGLLALRVTLGF